jgi:glycosyltransferase involved in cell wall biosynthesis
MLVYAAMLARLAESVHEFDVVHAHTDWLHIPLLSALGVPFVTTLHGRLDHSALQRSLGQFVDTRFVSISNAQRAPLPAANWAGTIYHGLPPDLLKPNFESAGYLAFLGRVSPEKGPEAAINIARAAGLPLKIAAKIGRADRAYFKKHIEPLIDGHQIEFVGEIGEHNKAAFLGNAVALLFPINWPEPFGLVTIEAMACATPVIAFSCGSVPEVIDDGVTGFVVTPDQALRAVAAVGSLDRRAVRARFEQRFTARRMAEDYSQIYQAVISSKLKLT